MQLKRSLALALQTRLRSEDDIDPEALRYSARVSVWVRWLTGAVCVVMLFYRPAFTSVTYAAYITLFLFLMSFNGYLHFRLVSKRPISRLWMLALSATDIALISVAIIVAGGFGHIFLHLTYFPALVIFAVTFTSFRLNMAWLTVVVVSYILIVLNTGPGLEFHQREEKALVARVVMMCEVVILVNLVTRFERMRKREVMEREIQRERVEMSQSIHDTVAQSAYMVGLGIDSAIELVDKSDEALKAKLNATSRLAKSAMWDLRHPIDMVELFEGLNLGDVLESHAKTFTEITSIPVDVRRTGEEQYIPSLARGLLFSIAHNALANVFRHSQASRVNLTLHSGAGELSICVQDNGVGLPTDFAVRGHGFRNMQVDAERIGSIITIESAAGGGTNVCCKVPYTALQGDR